MIDVTVALVEDKDRLLLRGGLLAGFLTAGAAAGLASHTQDRAWWTRGTVPGAGMVGALAGASRPAAAAAPTILANTVGATAGLLALYLQPPSISNQSSARSPRTIRQAAGMLALRCSSAAVGGRWSCPRRARRCHRHRTRL